MDSAETIELEIMNELHYNCDECPSPIEILFKMNTPLNLNV